MSRDPSANVYRRASVVILVTCLLSLNPLTGVVADMPTDPDGDGWPDGTVLLVLAYYAEGGERTVVGQRMVLVVGEDGGGGDGGDGDDRASLAVFTLACALVAVAVVWGLYVRRTRDTGS
jgi:hypothetical protein